MIMLKDGDSYSIVTLGNLILNTVIGMRDDEVIFLQAAMIGTADKLTVYNEAAELLGHEKAHKVIDAVIRIKNSITDIAKQVEDIKLFMSLSARLSNLLEIHAASVRSRHQIST
jgi:hypothetical protein